MNWNQRFEYIDFSHKSISNVDDAKQSENVASKYAKPRCVHRTFCMWFDESACHLVRRDYRIYLTIERLELLLSTFFVRGEGGISFLLHIRWRESFGRRRFIVNVKPSFYRIYKRFTEIWYFNGRWNSFYWNFMQIRRDHNKRGAANIEICIGFSSLLQWKCMCAMQWLTANQYRCSCCLQIYFGFRLMYRFSQIFAF